MKKIILHIGAGKCGSSALQAYLSRVPVLRPVSGEILKYGALGINGFIATGGSVTEKANSSIFQYSSSVLLTNTSDTHFDENFRQSIKKINADILVLSCEGWLGQSKVAQDKLKCLTEYEVEVLVYVRPPVDWLNSAWWQWGAWNGVQFDQWFSKSLPSTFWSRYIDAWKQIDFVDNIVIRNLPADVTQDFHEIYAVPPSTQKEERSNASLPGSVLRIFQQCSDLRPTAHEPQIDFSISRRLSQIRSRPDWVISSAQVDQAISATKDHNDKLLDYMDIAQRNIMLTHKAWWEGEYYEGKQYQDPASRDISDDEKDSLIYHSIVSLHRAEKEIIALKNKVRKLRNQS